GDRAAELNPSVLTASLEDVSTPHAIPAPIDTTRKRLVRLRFADARKHLVGYRRCILVEVVHAPLACLCRRGLYRVRYSRPLDRLDLVVHRTVRAVDGQ